jgi:hypothetical protein
MAKRLTEKKKQAIISMTGPAKQIASKFGVSEGTVWRLKKDFNTLGSKTTTNSRIENLQADIDDLEYENRALKAVIYQLTMEKYGIETTNETSTTH